MKIFGSILAADSLNYEKWIDHNIKDGIDGIHIDLIDSSFADYIGVDFSLISKIKQKGIEFDIHYMMKWSESLIEKILQYNPRCLFLHEKAIDRNYFFNKKNANLGIAIELDGFYTIDCQEYLIMNVTPGYSGQKFNEKNINLAKELKAEGKTITSDGGITINNIQKVKFFDEVVVGSGLSEHKVADFKK